MIILLVGLFGSERQTEVQSYEVLKVEGAFEVRYYPPAVMASVKMNGGYDNTRNQGFGTLAGYIFGGNEENMKISMTAPVRMSDSDGTMSFVMPSQYSLDALPTPDNRNVQLHTSEPSVVAVVRFSGWASERKIGEMKERLASWLEQTGYQHNRKFEYLGYNPPYQMINRRNEVLVPLINYPGNSAQPTE